MNCDLSMNKHPVLEFDVSAITPGHFYVGPSGTQVNECQCNSVYYNLISACAYCQNSTYPRYVLRSSFFDGHCSFGNLEAGQPGLRIVNKLLSQSKVAFTWGNIPMFDMQLYLSKISRQNPRGHVCAGLGIREYYFIVLQCAGCSRGQMYCRFLAACSPFLNLHSLDSP